MAVSAIGQSPVAEQGSTPSIVQNAIQMAYANIESIEFQTRVIIEETDAWRRDNKNPAKGRNGESRFAARGNKYFYRQILTEKLDGDVYGTDRAFDGKQFQHLDHRTGSLTISAHDPQNNHLDLGLTSPLTAYGFLIPFVSGQGTDISWNDLKQPKALSEMLQSAPEFETGKVGGHETVTARYKANMSRLWEQPVEVVVIFAKDMDYFPISYTFMTSKGVPLLAYTVSKCGKVSREDGSILTYAETAVCKAYDWGGKGELWGTVRLTTESFSINSVKDDSVFTLDPMTAKSIFDKDNKTVISVRK